MSSSRISWPRSKLKPCSWTDYNSIVWFYDLRRANRSKLRDTLLTWSVERIHREFTRDFYSSSATNYPSSKWNLSLDPARDCLNRCRCNFSIIALYSLYWCDIDIFMFSLQNKSQHVLTIQKLIQQNSLVSTNLVDPKKYFSYFE